MLADHLGELETVQPRHAHVDENDGDFVAQQLAQSLVGGGRLEQRLAQLAQHDFIAQQFAGLVVDQKDVDLLIRVHRAPICAATCAAPTEAARYSPAWRGRRRRPAPGPSWDPLSSPWR